MVPKYLAIQSLMKSLTRATPLHPRGGTFGVLVLVKFSTGCPVRCRRGLKLKKFFHRISVIPFEARKIGVGWVVLVFRKRRKMFGVANNCVAFISGLYEKTGGLKIWVISTKRYTRRIQKRMGFVSFGFFTVY
jgi:hypothetical protein